MPAETLLKLFPFSYCLHNHSCAVFGFWHLEHLNMFPLHVTSQSRISRMSLPHKKVYKYRTSFITHSNVLALLYYLKQSKFSVSVFKMLHIWVCLMLWVGCRSISEDSGAWSVGFSVWLMKCLVGDCVLILHVPVIFCCWLWKKIILASFHSCWNLHINICSLSKFSQND